MIPWITGCLTNTSRVVPRFEKSYRFDCIVTGIDNEPDPGRFGPKLVLVQANSCGRGPRLLRRSWPMRRPSFSLPKDLGRLSRRAMGRLFSRHRSGSSGPAGTSLERPMFEPAPVAGWASLLVGLAMLFLARTQDLISVEVFSRTTSDNRVRASSCRLERISSSCFSDRFFDFHHTGAGMDGRRRDCAVEGFYFGPRNEGALRSGLSSRAKWRCDHDRAVSVADEGCMRGHELDLCLVRDRHVLRLRIPMGI